MFEWKKCFKNTDISSEFFERVSSFNCCYEQDTRTLKRRMYREVLDSTPGLILLGITFLFQTMPSTYMPVILRQDYGIPESTSAIIISSSTLDIKICLIYGNNQNICWVSVWLNFTVPCRSFLYLFILLGFWAHWQRINRFIYYVSIKLIWNCSFYQKIVGYIAKRNV